MTKPKRKLKLKDLQMSLPNPISIIDVYNQFLPLHVLLHFFRCDPFDGSASYRLDDPNDTLEKFCEMAGNRSKIKTNHAWMGPKRGEDTRVYTALIQGYLKWILFLLLGISLCHSHLIIVYFVSKHFPPYSNIRKSLI